MQQSQELKNQEVAVEDLFLQSQESLEEALVRSAEENRSFSKTKHFRMDKLDTYHIRIVPLCPDSPRRGYEYGVRSMLLSINTPTGKAIYVNVCNAKQAGFSVDLLDCYRKVAQEYFSAHQDEEASKKLKEGTFSGGLKWEYQHGMYVLDVDNRREGLQLWTASHAQFMELEDRKLKLWEKKCKKTPNYPCPISSISWAYPIEIEKKKNNGKITYVFTIDNESDEDVLSRDELKALLAAPRVNDLLYRYSKYHFEATVEFLKQYDLKMGINLMAENAEIAETISKLREELPADDTSSFSYEAKKKGEDVHVTDTSVSLEDLFACHEELSEQGLGDKTEEGQELRQRIREYISDQGLQTRITRGKSNQQILEEVEAELEGVGEERREVPVAHDTDIQDTAEPLKPEAETASLSPASVRPARTARVPRNRG